MNLYSIYMYTGPTGKRYIGLTKDLASRHKQHANHKRSKCRRFATAVACYGINSFTRTILEDGLTQAQANERECYWIALLNTQHPNGYNMTDGGFAGVKHPSSLHKQAAAMKSNWAGEYRETVMEARMTPEARLKQSEATKALWRDPAYRTTQTEAVRKAVMSEASVAFREAQKTNTAYIASQSDRSKALWADPEYRERQMKARAEAKARKLAACVSS